MADRYSVFRELHRTGCFVIPNPWDAGSARMLERLGFPALASTSAGFAWSCARADHDVSVDEVLAHLRTLVAEVSVPVNADFEDGFAADPVDVETHVALAVDTDVAGLSIEDSTGDPLDPLYEVGLAADRVRAARAAIDRSGRDVILTGRSEGFIAGRPDLDATIHRLLVYASAGADCLYAPGLRTKEEVAAVVRAVAPIPVNVLAGSFATVAELADLGVRRVSVGGALARAAWKGFLDAAQEIATDGTFTRLAQGVPGKTLNEAFEVPEGE